MLLLQVCHPVDRGVPLEDRLAALGYSEVVLFEGQSIHHGGIVGCHVSIQSNGSSVEVNNTCFDCPSPCLDGWLVQLFLIDHLIIILDL